MDEFLEVIKEPVILLSFYKLLFQILTSVSQCDKISFLISVTKDKGTQHQHATSSQTLLMFIYILLLCV